MRHEVNVIADVIPPHRHTTRGRNRAVEIKNIVGRLSSDIDHEGSVLLALGIQTNLGRSNGSKNNIIDFERNLPHTFNAVLNAGPHAVNNVIVRIESPSQQSIRLRGMRLAVESVMPRKMVKINMITRDRDVAGDFPDLIQVAAIHPLFVVGQTEGSRVIDTLDVTPRHREKNTLDDNVTDILRRKQGRFYAGSHLLVIGNFSLPHSGGAGLAQTENFR